MSQQLRKNWKLLLLILSSASLIQCGKAGEEEKFEITVQSESPMVHDTPRTIYSNSGVATVLDPRWFEFNFYVKNGMGLTVKVEEVAIYVSIDGVESDPTSFDLGQFTYVDTNNVIHQFEYCSYAGNSTTSQRFSACEINNPTNVIPINYYIHGLKTPANPDDYSLPVRMVIKGVTMDGDTEKERFQKEITYYTH